MSDSHSTNGVKPHTSVTITTQSGLAPQDNAPMEIRLNIGYFKSLQGIIKLVQLVLGIVCMACAAPAQTIDAELYGLGHNHFFLFIVVTTFIISLIWTFFYLLQVKDTIKVKLPFTFMKLEVIFTLLATIFYIVAWIVILSGFGWCTTSHKFSSTICDARVAAGVFGIFNSIAYGLGTYLTYQEYNNTPPELQ